MEVQAEKAEKELLSLRSACPDLVLQIVSMKKPPSARAVEMIAAQTLRAMEMGSLLAEKPEVDLLLRLAGTNQITAALKTNGYKAAGTKLLVAAGPKSQLEALRRRLSGNTTYAIREPQKTVEVDLFAVETAALLGTRT